ncbi:PAQR family membrane homeostasis protein TrhA [Robiginitalea sediminis]|uniref:PAQR family membrane homeostasis protein TrhA n=1 Tax=Robiginitalea sediminis TaxID=1982593 RepID=UPI000B4A8C73|nr:hemolysin III family protein [Robiginitalea sediminis]
MPRIRISYREEEHWNTGTHMFGTILGLVGAVVLGIQVRGENTLIQAAVWAYSLSLILLFGASTAYHAVALPRYKKRLRILDHICIYYLIAGTYTPMALIVLAESKGWLLFGLVWGMAAFGTVLKLFFTGRFELFSVLLYLLMGWLIVIDLDFLLTTLSHQAQLFLMAGGGFYTVGILFYAIRKIPFNHMIWHLFVLCGAACHWVMVWLVLRG